MKAAIYNPYLDTLGGGERYTMSFAKVLSGLGYQIYVQWKDRKISKKLETRFGLNLNNFEFVNDVKNGDGYDLCFWVSDGSIPLLKARKNYIHFQIPFTKVSGSSLYNKMKFVRVNAFICNSKFTKHYVDKEYSIASHVIYPPVDLDKFKSKRKENLILAVGRFSQLTQAKRQDILISSFKKLVKSGLSGWKLVLVGGSEVGVGNYLLKLKKLSKGLNVDIIEGPEFSRLVDLYGRSKIFWSASGYKVNANITPLRVEHFGISVVEAMSSGSVPIIYNAGGHKEIVKRNTSGFLWHTTKKLMSYTSKLTDNPKLLREMAKKAKERSKKYSYEHFEDRVKKIVS